MSTASCRRSVWGHKPGPTLWTRDPIETNGDVINATYYGNCRYCGARIWCPPIASWQHLIGYFTGSIWRKVE